MEEQARDLQTQIDQAMLQLKLPELKAELLKLQTEAQAPDFWNDSTKAQESHSGGFASSHLRVRASEISADRPVNPFRTDVGSIELPRVARMISPNRHEQQWLPAPLNERISGASWSPNYRTPSVLTGSFELHKSWDCRGTIASTPVKRPTPSALHRLTGLARLRVMWWSSRYEGGGGRTVR